MYLIKIKRLIFILFINIIILFSILGILEVIFRLSFTEFKDQFHRRSEITLGKNNNLQSKKNLFSKLQSKYSVEKLTKNLSQRYEKRNGGYCRVIRSGYRYGDDAPMAVIELVDRDVAAKKIDVKKKEETINKEATTKSTVTPKAPSKKTPTKKKAKK